jgi:hypothetical protein
MRKTFLLLLIGLFLWMFAGGDSVFLHPDKSKLLTTQKSPLGQAIQVVTCLCVSCKKHHAHDGINDTKAACCCENVKNDKETSVSLVITALCDERDPISIPALPILRQDTRALLACALPPITLLKPHKSPVNTQAFLGFIPSPTFPPPRFLS